MPIGKRGLFNLQNDGVSVLRASGVGGGSLVYSKIMLRPPETLFEDPRWPGAWRGPSGAALRNRLFEQALRGVTVGVENLIASRPEAVTGMTGPSQILMRSPGITPASIGVAPVTMARADPKRAIWQIRIAPDKNRLTDREGELIDRARVFQTAMSALTPAYGTVDLAINDMDFAPPSGLLSKAEQGTAERQKALRAAGHQLLRAPRPLQHRLPARCGADAEQAADAGDLRLRRHAHDRSQAPGRAAIARCKQVALQLTPLAQVDHISEREGGGYLVHYRQRRIDDPSARRQPIVVSADRVIIAAGSLGTAELLLRSQQRAAETGGAEGLRGLSARVGDGFSPNGDHIAFLPETKERVNLTYGPVTTSYGQFKADAPKAAGFHQIEDQGVPRALGRADRLRRAGDPETGRAAKVSSATWRRSATR